jgi:hypothetical protein
LAAAITQPLAAAGVKMVVWEFGSAGSLASLLLSDPLSRQAIAEVRLYPQDSRGTSQSTFDDARESAIRSARRAARDSQIGTIAALAVRVSDDDALVAEGAVGIALIHAGGVESTTHTVAGRPEEIRRRAALLAAEFLWRELRRAAGGRPEID